MVPSQEERGIEGKRGLQKKVTLRVGDCTSRRTWLFFLPSISRFVSSSTCQGENEALHGREPSSRSSTARASRVDSLCFFPSWALMRGLEPWAKILAWARPSGSSETPMASGGTHIYGGSYAALAKSTVTIHPISGK